MSSKEIIIKGSLDKLKVYYGSEISLIELKAFLRRKFGLGSFFYDAEYNIEFIDRGWSKEDKWQIEKLLAEISPKLKVGFFYEEEDLPADKMPALVTYPMIAKKNFRSGQKAVAPGDLIVIGDINPGAELVAGGDILIFGRVVGGILHAGATGDLKAKVIALSLQPTQLRIGSVISRAPDAKGNKNSGAEIARVTGGKIVIENFSAK